MKKQTMHTFLAANTANGFMSHFDELQNPERQSLLYVIKGGPGTGKSTMLKKISRMAEEKGLACEKIHCSADPDSLDGVILGEHTVAVVDGTPPHSIEPRFPGAYERIVNFHFLFDNDGLQKKKAEIIALSKQNREAHLQTVAYLSAAGTMKQDNIRLAEHGLIHDKVEHYAKYHMPVKTGKVGRENKRFLTACTGDGIRFFSETLMPYATIISIDDQIGAAAAELLFLLSAQYRRCGYITYQFYCPLAPTGRMEHLLVPEKSICFTTANKMHSLPKEKVTRTIHASRFYQPEILGRIQKRLRFNEKVIRTMTEAACAQQALALKIHDRLEELYTPMVNFERGKDFFAAACQEIIQEAAAGEGRRAFSENGETIGNRGLCV